MTTLAWLLLCATVAHPGQCNHSTGETTEVKNINYASDAFVSPQRSQTDGDVQVNTELLPGLKTTSLSERKKRDQQKEPIEHENSRKKPEKTRDKKKTQEEKYNEHVRMLTIGFGSAICVAICGAAIAIVVLVVYYRRKNKKTPPEPKREELAADNGLTIIRREGLPDKYVVKGCDFRIMGPLVRARVHAEPPAKHKLEDQEGGDLIDNIFFDKNLNEAYFIGEGVEIVEEDSVSISEGKTQGPNPIELFAAMDPDEMIKEGDSQKSKKKKFDWKYEAKIPDSVPKSSKDGKKSSKSSKSKRAKNSNPKNSPSKDSKQKTPSDPKNPPPSSGSKNPSSSGSDGKKK